MYSREENVITCVPGKFPGECRPMLLPRKNRARGPVPSLRIDERIKTFPPELSSFRRGKGFRRICFVPARSILETRQGTKGKSSGIRGRERGEKEGKGLFVWYAGSSSGLISYDNDIQTENIGARIDEDLGSGRHFPTQRTISGETRLSINLCAPLYFSSSSAGDRRYLVLPAIRIGCLQVWGHALHAGHPVTLTSREHETSFQHVEHHFDHVCATTIGAKRKTRCPSRSRMRGHLVTGIKNRSYIIFLRVYKFSQAARETDRTARTRSTGCFYPLDRYLI